MSDPKDPQRLFDNRTLWLDQDANTVARERFWAAFQAHCDHEPLPLAGDQRIWNIAWAAAIAAMSLVMEGNLGPKPEA